MALNSGMDYGSLLQLAKKTSDMKKQAKRGGPPPVRTATDHKIAEEEKKKLLNANVAKFLAKREAEEKKRKLEADKMREGLLAIRNKDSKARKRVKIMNKSAKSADKSAIEDAVGPSDYYVIEEPLCFMSQESLVQEEKFLEKLCKVPQEEIFSKKKANLNKDLSGTKDRVKMALLLGDAIEKKEKREAKEKLKEHNHKEKGRNDKKIEIEEPQVEEKPKKPRQPRPPPMNYLELLKLAEKLQQEPVREAPKEKEPELRPMTTKERELYLLEEASRKRKEEGYKPPKKKIDKTSSSSQFQGSKFNSSVVKEDKSISSIPRIPKLNDNRHANEKKSGSYEERRPKSSREDKDGSSNQKSSHRFEENTNLHKQNSRQNDSPITAKYNSNPDKNRIDRAPKQEVSRHSRDERSSPSSKSQGMKREKDQSGSSRPSLQQEGKHSTVSRETKESKGSSSVGIKPTTDGKSNSKKPFDNARNVTLDKSNSQLKPATLSSTKPREYQPDTHVGLPKKFPSSDMKSNNILNSKPKQGSPDMKSKQVLPCSKQPKPTDNKPRQLSSSDSKTKQYHSETKSRSLTPSDSKHISDLKSRQPSLNVKPKQHPTSDAKSTPVSKTYSKPEAPSSPNIKSRTLPLSDVRPRNFPPSDVEPRGRNFPPSDVKPRNFPPSDVKPRKVPPSSNTGPKQFPPPDVKRKQFPPADVRRGPKTQAKKRRVIDSDDEYDSEVADFIDDGPDDCEDYSKHIREIFGYDRSRYRGMDEDDECMESSFSQQMKEEFKSTKLGIMEDLEDIRREKQREAMLKKKRRLK